MRRSRSGSQAGSSISSASRGSRSESFTGDLTRILFGDILGVSWEDVWIPLGTTIAVAIAAVAWCVSVAALLAGGTRRDLRRTRRAIILAGTPWYCLVVYLATYL